VTVNGALRAVLTACLLGALGVLAGCAHAPPAPAPSPRVTVSVSPPPTPESSSSTAASPELAAETPQASAEASLEPSPDTDVDPEPITGIDASAYADLFDRMRAGFALDEVDRPAVTEQLTWFAENPDFVQRSFEHAE